VIHVQSSGSAITGNEAAKAVICNSNVFFLLSRSLSSLSVFRVLFCSDGNVKV
jgi:hypothetical protein